MDPDDSSGTGERLGTLLDSVDLCRYYGPLNVLDEALAEALVALAAAASCTLPVHGAHLYARAAKCGAAVPLHGTARALCHPSSGNGLARRPDRLRALRSCRAMPGGGCDDAAAYAVPDPAHVMQTFGRRTDVTLGAFGWRQVDTPDGPTFETLGLRGSPTGAVIGERSWNEVNQKLARDLLNWVGRQRGQRPKDG